MAPIKTLDIDRLDTADLSAALGLSAEAGWNQTEADWRIFLDLGQVFTCRDDAGKPVATAAILPYGDFAWISMVLVTSSHRQQGLGTHLLKHCIATLQRMGCTPYLDATPAGEKVYLPLGFRPVFGITRWQGQGDGKGGEVEAVDPDICLSLDAHAFGARRAPLLKSFLSRVPGVASHTGDAFVVARNGRLATQIGPMTAPDETSALTLLRRALDRADGPVFLDVPDRWASLSDELKRRGFTIQRGFRRMALNSNRPNGEPARSFVIAGPEFG